MLAAQELDRRVEVALLVVDPVLAALRHRDLQRIDGRLDFRGGPLDYLGLGSNFRKLPERVPASVTFNQLNEAERDAIGRSFRDIWNTERIDAAPIVQRADVPE